MRVGYARVSTQEQTLDLQTDALQRSGCDRVFTDKVSGMKAHKPQFELMMSYLRAGDTIVIWKLDRLGRSTRGLIELVEGLSQKGIHLVSLNDPIDTTSPGGLLVFQIFCALTEHERNVIVQRTRNAREDTNNRRAAAMARSLRQLGSTWAEITRQLNEFGFRTRRGTLFQIVQVQRVVRLFEGIDSK